MGRKAKVNRSIYDFLVEPLESSSRFGYEMSTTRGIMPRARRSTPSVLSRTDPSRVTSLGALSDIVRVEERSAGRLGVRTKLGNKFVLHKGLHRVSPCNWLQTINVTGR